MDVSEKLIQAINTVNEENKKKGKTLVKVNVRLTQESNNRRKSSIEAQRRYLGSL